MTTSSADANQQHGEEALQMSQPGEVHVVEQQDEKHSADRKEREEDGTTSTSTCCRSPSADSQTENDEEEKSSSPLLPLSVTMQAEPRLMEISNQERDWALRIKRTVEAAPDLDNLPDMMYAHLAIFAQGDLDCAVHRVYNLQEYKKEYKILDSTAQANRLFKRFLFDHFPAFLLNFDFQPELGHSLFVFDFTKADKHYFRCHRKFSEFLHVCYYFCQAMFPNFEVVRKGHLQIVECEGFDPSKNMVDGKIFTRVLSEIHGSYPTVYAQLCMYHTPMSFNLMVALAKRSLPINLLSKLSVGCTFPGRLDQFYGLPTLEAATQRTFNNLNEALRIRYENERTFRLG
ncbi:expressed unknown protein [Seminavis robusta]|uniref:CRAL-TRIO domain-containing protein n=1 Tax=Seminavis robusta TaxID=568900 RepID=A0A9N8ES61_9STRA|nr:expressed unknown protein [Seminavis robusta]|eukprot:Sro1677_g290590.1 n/a (345) ;mRNA; f:15155-16315